MKWGWSWGCKGKAFSMPIAGFQGMGQVIADGRATSIYYRIQFIPSKDAIVNATIDPTIVWVSQQQMTEQMAAHKKQR